MGDWLYMSALRSSLKERSLAILDILTRLTRKMTEGELIQLTMLGDQISAKTNISIFFVGRPLIFSGCCEIGAILGGVGPKEQAAVREYGMDLGLRFSWLTMCSISHRRNRFGKASGADLLEGKITLPLLLLQKSEPSVKSMLIDVMYEGNYADGTRRTLLEKLELHGILENVRIRCPCICEQSQEKP